MPAKSAKQEKFMRAVAHSPSFAKKVGVPMSVGREFTKSGGGMPVRPMTESKVRSQESDEAKRDAVGGKAMKKGGMAESKKMMGKEIAFMQKKGAPKSMVKHEMKEAGMKYGGKVKKMASGGLAAGHKSADGIASKGKTKAKQITMRSGGMCK